MFRIEVVFNILSEPPVDSGVKLRWTILKGSEDTFRSLGVKKFARGPYEGEGCVHCTLFSLRLMCTAKGRPSTTPRYPPFVKLSDKA